MSDGALHDHSPGTAMNHGGERESTDNSAATGCSNSSMADSLNLLILSVITGFDRTADATSRSQDQLSSSLDRLTRELDNLLEDAPSTFIMQHSARISRFRKRVIALNYVLKPIQQRIDNMDRMISAGLMRELQRELVRHTEFQMQHQISNVDADFEDSIVRMQGIMVDANLEGVFKVNLYRLVHNSMYRKVLS
ncbi:uncharacterized protein [Henckelia pumila]